ncbi:hypothetical protein HanRHA438_Chr01g0028381 [Helianthus annuus]|nr:hypothetical protein HanRHA438_Chr01g0028381 [Helianthus annuus]
MEAETMIAEAITIITMIIDEDVDVDEEDVDAGGDRLVMDAAVAALVVAVVRSGGGGL